MSAQENTDKKPTAIQAGKRYKCVKCGSEAMVTKAGGSTLKCCGEEMQFK